MSKKNQIWKYSWNPSGYFEQEIELDLSKKYVNDLISLPHKFFKTKDFGIYTKKKDGTKKYFTCIEGEASNSDFVFDGYDADLTKVAGFNVYSKIRLCSNKVANLNSVYVDCCFLADIVDYEDFGQSLNKDSDVNHKSLTLTESLNAPKAEVEEISSESISGDWGIISKKEVCFKKPVSFDGLSLKKNGIEVKECENLVFGTETDNFSISFKRGYVSFFNKGKERMIFSVNNDISDIPYFGIPFIPSNSKATLTFVPWLSVDPNLKGIKMEGGRIGDSEFSIGNISLNRDSETASIDLCSMPFVKAIKNKEFTMFDGLIRVDLEKKEVFIKGISLEKLLKKIGE